MPSKRDELQPGPNQDKEWTDAQRLEAWLLYLNHLPGDGMWSKMSETTGKSIYACKTECWKISHAGDGKRPYFLQSGRLRVKVTEDRNDVAWTEHEKFILNDAMEDGLPMPRICELLGRTEANIQAQVDRKLGRDRPSFFK